MNTRKKKKVAIWGIIIGLVLIIAAGSLYAYNWLFDYNADHQSQNLLDEIVLDFEWELPSMEDIINYIPSEAAPIVEISEDQRVNSIEVYEDPFDDDDDNGSGNGGSGGYTGTWSAPSYSVIGIISIPRLDKRLPVLSDCSEYLLGISCCRVSGFADDKPSRLVIAGHNLYSQFKGLDVYELGDIIAFTTINGVTYYYEAVQIEAIHKTEGAKLLEATGWDLCLFTCKSNRVMRTVVYFAEVKATEN